MTLYGNFNMINCQLGKPVILPKFFITSMSPIIKLEVDWKDWMENPARAQLHIYDNE